LSGAPELSWIVCSVGHETPGLDILTITEDRWQPRTERQRNDPCAVGSKECSSHDVKCVRLAFEHLEGGSDILRLPDFEWRDFEAKHVGCGLNLTHLQPGLGITNINHDCQPAEAGDNLTQDF